MRFEIYDESRLDDHIDLVQEVIKDWDWKSWYPTKEQISEIYSREGFTADTRHYLYEGDLLVGFLSTSMEDIEDGIQFGSIHRLFVRKGYEKYEDKIMEKSIELLKSRGAKAIRTNVRPGMGNYIEVLERWGFGDRTILDYSSIFQVEKYISNDYFKLDELIDIDLATQTDLLLEALLLDSSKSREELAERLKYLIETNRVIRATAIKKENKIVAYALLYRGNAPERAFILPFIIAGEPSEEIVENLFYFTISKAKEAKKTLLYHQITNMDLKKYYKNIDLKFVPAYKYILKV